MSHPNNNNNNNDARQVLYEREMTELDTCLQNIELFRKYIRDYEGVRERLTTLADKTSHDIMVPIAGSKLAFMPGFIHHTNEILVLIGDNYFVEKSTKEATEFVDRRMTFCFEKIEELEAQRNMLNNWLKATAEVKNEHELVEINETWSEDDLEKWKIEHRKKVEEHRRNSKHQSNDIDINQIFAKYEAQEPESESSANNEDQEPQVGPKKLIEEPISPDDIVERTEAISQIKASETSQTRPISKFKASRKK